MTDQLLTHIVKRFAADRYEDLATEALAYVLRASPSALRAVGAFASSLAEHELTVHRVTTQVVDRTSESRPDLVLYDRDGRPTVVLEAKFDAGLTANQPQSYLSQTEGLVLVVCPARRVEPLWPELLRRCDELGGAVDRSKGGTARRAAVGHRTLALVPWTAVVEAVRSAVRVEDPQLLGDVEQLAAMCSAFEAEVFLPFTSEELTADTGRRITQLNDLLDDVVSRTLQQPDVDKQGLRSASGAGWYGHYLNLPAGWQGFLHVSAHKWARKAPTPFWLWVRESRTSVHNPAVVEDVLAPLWGTPLQPHLDERWQIPLHPPTNTDRAEVLRVLCEQVNRVLTLIRQSTNIKQERE